MAETEQIGGPGMQRAGQSGAVAASSPGAKALAIVSALRERVMAMPAGKRTWLLASVAFLAAMVGFTSVERFMQSIFFLLFLVAAPMGAFGFLKLILGKYKNFQPCKWKDRPW